MSLRDSCKPQKKTIKKERKNVSSKGLIFTLQQLHLTSYSKTQVKVHSRIEDKR
jgi:hypothetical protein